MIKNMNNGTIKNDHKNKQSCNDWIIYGNKTRILKFLFATLRILKRSSQHCWSRYHIVAMNVKSLLSFLFNIAELFLVCVGGGGGGNVTCPASLNIYVYIYIFYKSRKLQCYTGNSGPEKRRNNTREKISYFLHVCWYSQSAADTWLALGTTP